MARKRKGEEGHPPFRGERLFNVGTDWYFSTREKDMGPYPTKEDAQAELALYLRKIAMGDQEISGD